MLEVYKPHTNREAVGVWLCSAAKRPSKRSALVILILRLFPGQNLLFLWVESRTYEYSILTT